MKKIINYITGNPDKVRSANQLLSEFNIEVNQKKVDIDEIQSDSIEEIAIDKAKKAFELIKEPLFVNDAGWLIPALNGFPGPFMKFVNDWFSATDFLNLMKDHENREIILREVTVYIDKDQTKIFTHDVKGTILKEIFEGEGKSSDKVVSLTNDGTSIAQANQENNFASAKEQPMWSEFGKWLSKS